MSSVDQRIVQMTFDNKEFERNVATSMTTLDKLKSALDFEGSSKSLQGIEKAAKNIDLSSLSDNVQFLADRFSNMGIVSMEVLKRLTNAAIDAGKKMVNAVLSPIKSGGWNRAMNIEQAKFQIEGLKKDWDIVKEDVLYGVKDTAYGLDEAAKVASQLLASSVETGDAMKMSLRAVSGVAAMTNSSYSEIGHIFTTVAGQGKVMTEQLRMLEGRGLNAASTLAEYLNVTEAEVRDMVTKGAIDFETFSAAMDNAFGPHAAEANKTFTGSLSNMKAALSRIGADFATPLMENGRKVFNAITPIIDLIHEKLAPIITDVTEAMNAITDFAIDKINGIDLSFVDIIAEVFHNVYTIVKEVVGIIRDAWNYVFPSSTREKFDTVASYISQISDKFKNATDKVKSFFLPITETIDTVMQGADTALNAAETIEGMANRVINGEFGDGDARRKALEDLGLSYEVIQNKVNELLGDSFRYETAEEDLIQTTNALAGSQQELAVEQGKASAAIQKPVTAFDKLKNVFVGLFSAVDIVKQTLGAVIKGASGPVLGFLKDLGGLLLNVGSAIGVWLDGVRQSLYEMGFFDKLSAGVNATLTTFFNILRTIGSVISTVFTGAKSVFLGLKENVDAFLSSFKMTSGFERLSEIIGKLKTNISDFLSGVFGKLIDKITGFSGLNISMPTLDMASFANSVSDKIEWVLDKIASVRDEIKNFFSHIFGGGKETFDASEGLDKLGTSFDIVRSKVGFLATPLGKFSDLLKKAKNAIINFLKNFKGRAFSSFEKMAPLFKNIRGEIDKFFGKLKNVSIFKPFFNALEKVKDALSSLFDKLRYNETFKSFTSSIGRVKDKLMDFFSNISSGTVEKFTGLRDGLVGFFDSFTSGNLLSINGFTEAMSKVGEKVSEFILNLKGNAAEKLQGFADIFGNAKEKVINFFSSFSFTDAFSSFVSKLIGAKDRVLEFFSSLSGKNLFSLEGFVEVVGKLKDHLGEVFKKISDEALEKFGTFGEYAATAVEKLKEFFSNFNVTNNLTIGEFVTLLSTAKNNASEFIASFTEEKLSNLGSFGTKVLDIKNGISELIEKLTDSALKRIGDFAGLLSEAKSKVSEFFSSFNFFDNWNFSTFTGLVESAKQGIGEFLGVFVPDKLTSFGEFKELVQKMQEAFEKFFGTLENSSIARIATVKDLIGKLKDNFSKFFETLTETNTNRFASFTKLISDTKNDIKQFFAPIKESTVSAFKGLFSTISGNLNTIGDLGDKFKELKEKAGDILQPILNAVSGITRTTTDIFSSAFDAAVSVVQGFLDGLNSITLGDVGNLIKDGTLAALVIGVIDLIYGLGQLSRRSSLVSKGMFKNLKAAAFETNANAFLTIANAIAVLAGSLMALSLVNSDKLNNAATALSAVLLVIIGLVKTMKSFEQGALTSPLDKLLGFLKSVGDKLVKMAGLGIMMAGIGVALKLILDVIMTLESISFMELLAGLGQVVTIIGVIGLLAASLSKLGGGNLGVGANIALIAVALNLVAAAIKGMKGITFSEYGEGLGVLAVGIIAVAGAFAIAGAAGMASGVGMIAMSGSLLLLALALRAVQGLSLEDVADGLKALGLALAEALVGLLALAVVSAALSPVAPIMLAIAAAVALLGVGLIALEAGLKGISIIGDALYGLVDVISKTAEVVFPVLGQLFYGFIGKYVAPGILNGFIWIGNQLMFMIRDFVAMLMQNLADLIGKLPFGIGDTLNTVMNGFVSIMESWDGFDYHTIGENIFEPVVEGVKDGGDTVCEAIDEAGEKVKKYLSTQQLMMMRGRGDTDQEIYDYCVKWGFEIPDSVAEGIENGTVKVSEAAEDMYDSAYSRAAKAEVEEEARLGGYDIGTAVSEGVEESAPSVNNALQQVMNMFGGSIDTSGADAAAQTWLGALTGGIENGSGDTAEAINALLANATSMTGEGGQYDASSLFNMLGGDITQYIGEGMDPTIIEGSLANVMSQVGEYGQGIVGEDGLDLGSLYTSMFGSGIDGSTDSVMNPVNDMLGSIFSTFTSSEWKGNFKTGGEALSKSYGLGIASQRRSPLTEAASIAAAVVTSFASQATGSMIAGSTQGQSYANGIAGTANSAYSAGSSIALSAVNAAASYGQSYYNAGYNAGIGFNNGLGSVVNRVARTARDLAVSARDAITNTLRIMSPSRVTMWAGEMTGIGFAKGIEGTVGEVAKAGETVADAGSGAIMSMNSAIETLAESLGTDTEFAPTITPVLDLSEIQNGTKTISDLLPDQSTLYSVGVSGYAEVSVLAAEINANTAAILNRVDEMNMKMDAMTTMIQEMRGSEQAAFISMMYNMMSQYFPQFADKEVMLDTGEVVGALTPRVSVEMRNLVNRRR